MTFPEPRGSTRLLRVMNERLLMDRLRETGVSSRVELARATGLSKPTVSAAIEGLIDAGLAQQVGELSGKPGPVSALYDMNTRSAFVLGVDIGREWIRVAVADLRGDFVARRDGRNSAKNAAELVRRVRVLAEQSVAEAGVASGAISCAVIGGPGVVEPVTGRIELAPNLSGWGEQGLAGRFRQALGVEVWLENDVNLAAVGEHAYGHGKGKNHFVLVSIGTGVGMGIVINGQLYTGARGAAGEISYLPAAGADPAADDEIRSHGPAESVVAAAAIARSAGQAGLAVSSTREVFAAAAAGDRTALSIVNETGKRIGELIVAVTAVLDPELVVLTGGVGDNVDLLATPISEQILAMGPLRPVVTASALGTSGVLHGAIAKALDRAWTSLFEARL